jgi:hypothetical protein
MSEIVQTRLLDLVPVFHVAKVSWATEKFEAEIETR